MKLSVTFSTSLKTRIMLPPAILAKSSSVQPLSMSSANTFGYLETSSAPTGVNGTPS